jgi:hypothetical protein
VEALSLLDLAVIMTISSFPFWAMEFVKLLHKRFRLVPQA